MPKQDHAGEDSAAPPVKFNEMNFWQKCAHLGKVILFLLTLGFAFPNILDDR